MRGDDYGPPLKPAEITTHDGCTCKKACGTNVYEDYGRCDWCYTKDGCGTSGLKGSWDYCEYSPMQDFESQLYSDKTAQLWSRITDPGVVDQSGPAHLFAKSLKDAVSISMITPFDDQWEVLPPGREKVIHGQGVMCQFDLAVRPDSPFTGILASGTQSGLIRLGSAVSLNEPLIGNIFPGFGIKFLRSGVHSAGFVGLRKAGKGGSYNFFDSTFSNHVPPEDALVKLNKFQQASGCIDMVGLSDVCSYTQDGQKVDKPVFPFELFFEPTGEVNFEDQKKGNDDLLNELAGIPDGTDVFEIRAFASPMDASQGNVITIGTLTTKGTCHRSLFGDQELFFRHQRMEEDFALAPDWIQQMEVLGDPACVASPGPVSQWQCPGQAVQGLSV